MTSVELKEHFAFLNLTQTDAAQLLSVAPRTVRRWLEGEDVPGPVEQAFRAWRRLQERGLAWRPDSVTVFQDDKQQIALLREHAKEIDAILAKVEARGGPRLPWTVDRERCRAVLGPMEVSFYRLPNGGFSASYYRRTDGSPDVRRDRELIEDAIFCFAEAVKKERGTKAKRAG
jgi:hypothetical protein